MTEDLKLVNITTQDFGSAKDMELHDARWEKMSENYCSWIHKGKDVNSKSPYNPFIESQEALDTQRNIVNNDWKAIKAARKARKKAKEISTDKPSEGIANGKAGNKTKFKGLNTNS